MKPIGKYLQESPRTMTVWPTLTRGLHRKTASAAPYKFQTRTILAGPRQALLCELVRYRLFHCSTPRFPAFWAPRFGNSVLRRGDLGEFVRQLSDWRLAARELEFSRLTTKNPIIGDARQENRTQATMPDQRDIAAGLRLCVSTRYQDCPDSVVWLKLFCRLSTVHIALAIRTHPELP